MHSRRFFARWPHKRHSLLTALLILISLQLLFPAPVVAAEAHDWHQHHVSALFGAARKSSKTQPFVGLDYEYRYNDHFGFGAYYEEVWDNIDLQAFGFLLTYHPDNHWKIFGGPAVERKLDSEESKLLMKVAVGYDFHVGDWSHGPVVAVDFVEDNHQVGYLGWTVGYGF
jgi:uncharacterized protein YhjY with autotransporter beta-barrel domain